MTFKSRFFRFIGGLALLVILVAAGFALAFDASMKWGATPELDRGWHAR